MLKIKPLHRKLYRNVAIGAMSLALTVGVGFYSQEEGQFNPMYASVMPVLEEVVDKGSLTAPNLAIENATLKKVSVPTDDFNYYRYVANVVIYNHGGDIVDGKVVLGAGEGQRHIFIKNGPDGFTLAKGQSYIVNDYDVIFDGDYNGGSIELEVELKDAFENVKDNNKFELDIFELPAKIDSIGLVDSGNDYEINFVVKKANLTDSFEQVSRPSLPNFEGKYDEVDGFGYHRIKASNETMELGAWRVEEKSLTEAKTFERDGFVYIRAVDPATGNYVVSNILKLTEHDDLTRSNFAMSFVEYADIEIFDDGAFIYEDVSESDKFGPYVQTIYNLGLIGTGAYKFQPDLVMERGDVIRVLLDYYDVDLENPEEGHFDDVPRDDELYPYAEALYASGSARAFSDGLNLQEPASKAFLKYLINEFS